jgi:hypothetical protein
MHKILLACPISDLKEYILWDWLDYIKKLNYPVDILLVDNSKSDNLQKRIYEKYPNCAQFVCTHIIINKKDITKRLIMAESMETIRRQALIFNYDYLFSLECDVFPPFDIIEKLLETNAPVTGATYFINHGVDSKIMLQRMESPAFGNDSIVRMFTRDEGFLFCDGTIKHIFSCGLGCVLIKTDILKKIKFRVEDNKQGQPAHHDFFFFKDLYSLKIPVLVDTSIICKHFNSSWNKIFENERQSQS